MNNIFRVKEYSNKYDMVLVKRCLFFSLPASQKVWLNNNEGVKYR